MFGRNKKDKSTPAAAPAVAPQVPETAASQTGPAKEWNEQMADALPKKATYFNAVRTDAYENLNGVENYVEFWAALLVDKENDKWRVMHYMIYSLDQEDGKFISEPLVRDTATGLARDVSFPEALFHLGKMEYIAHKMATSPAVDLQERYPEDKHPELKVYYYDLEHYKPAGNIEGIAFDDANQPYRRVEGRVFAKATFTREEVRKSILAGEQARDNAKVKNRIEAGLLSDIYNTASSRAASFDDILKASAVLSAMDSFVTHVGAVYLAVQQAIGVNDGLEKIAGLKPEDRAAVLKDARAIKSAAGDDLDGVLSCVIPDMKWALSNAKGEGVYVEPFEKFTAECALYINLLQASQALAGVEGGLSNVRDTSRMERLADIKQSVERAQETFVELGGTPAEMDKLKAWVANRRKDEIPGWLPGFMTRHYEARTRMLEKMRERKATARDLGVMPAAVKPPVADDANAQPLSRVPAPKPD
jgi:hypothetical protein